jgi:hypothetical protein
MGVPVRRPLVARVPRYLRTIQGVYCNVIIDFVLYFEGAYVNMNIQ